MLVTVTSSYTESSHLTSDILQLKNKNMDINGMLHPLVDTSIKVKKLKINMHI